MARQLHDDRYGGDVSRCRQGRRAHPEAAGPAPPPRARGRPVRRRLRPAPWLHDRGRPHVRERVLRQPRQHRDGRLLPPPLRIRVDRDLLRDRPARPPTPAPPPAAPIAAAPWSLRWTFDERTEDGLVAGYALKRAKQILEDPEAAIGRMSGACGQFPVDSRPGRYARRMPALGGRIWDIRSLRGFEGFEGAVRSG